MADEAKIRRPTNDDQNRSGDVFVPSHPERARGKPPDCAPSEQHQQSSDEGAKDLHHCGGALPRAHAKEVFTPISVPEAVLTTSNPASPAHRPLYKKGRARRLPFNSKNSRHGDFYFT